MGGIEDAEAGAPHAVDGGHALYGVVREGRSSAAAGEDRCIVRAVGADEWRGGAGEQSAAILLTGLPDPLFEDAKKWDLQKKGPRGKMRNDGRWWKLRQ